ncbi:MAG: amino acid ABC transporter substrate-binding protein [Rickettsiales bacterium]|nr:amino acid ABC transporter substrate-binding protein [Rickettsiales bacterium]
MIRRTLNNIIFIFLLVLISAFHVRAEQKTFIVGVSAQYPPFVFIREREIVGFEIDLITILANNLGYDLEFKDMPFRELLPALRNKKIDAAISAISATKERKKLIDFSLSYYFPKLAVLTMEKNNIDSLKDLQGKTVAAVSGTVMEEFLIQTLSLGRQMKIMSFISRDFMIQALEKGKIDAILSEDALAYREKAWYDGLFYFTIYYPQYSNANSYAIALQKNSKLRDEFNNELVSLKISEQFSNLKKKWNIK